MGRSLRALLSSFLLLALLRQVLTHAAAIVPALLEALLERRRQLSARATAAATGTGARRPSSPSGDAPSAGVRYQHRFNTAT